MGLSSQTTQMKQTSMRVKGHSRSQPVRDVFTIQNLMPSTESDPPWILVYHWIQIMELWSRYTIQIGPGTQASTPYSRSNVNGSRINYRYYLQIKRCVANINRLSNSPNTKEGNDSTINATISLHLVNF